ncbi:unnamed protein product [Leptidea sinapis]|uniref:Sortilin-related receptor n=1 Tax=Leptidea sinapis TaxID=189913 RepID=A0A5E4Q352_9NEOP|nr:unnamed protein product [Leptidea sinapis]
MSALLGQYIFTIGLFLTFYSVLCQENSKSLYVAEDPHNSRKITVINRNVEQTQSDVVERQKRDATTLSSAPPVKNISTWTTHLNDSHQQLMVHWVGEGSNVIICLARDSSPRNKASISPSALYISYDYGKNFTNKTESFRLGDEPTSGYAQLDKFFNHPKYPEFCVFIDSTNKKLYMTSDNGQTIRRTDLNFHPNELAFDEEFPVRFVILDKTDPNRNLYLTLDGGKTFKLIQTFVKTFFWSSGPEFPKVFYVEQWKPKGMSTVLQVQDPANMRDAQELFAKAKDFQIKGDYMFATRQAENKNNVDLYISYQRGPFYKAKFQTELDLVKFHIADVTDKRIFVSVMHTETVAHLYVSEINTNFTEYNFVLSLKQVLCYFPDGNWKDSWLEDVTEDPFTDLYRVEGLKGIYIASKVNSKSLIPGIEPDHLVSVITYDHGATWSSIAPPAEDENGKPFNCHLENSCSLHLCQKFSQLYPVTSPPGNVINNDLRSASIMSSKSAPGVIMATGVIGKSLKGIPGVYLSRDAGLTWKRILKDYYFFNYGDHGGVLVAVKYFKSRGETRRILYSTNEGMDWNSYEFNAEDLRIYGLMTEPGENTTTFTMFGSANEQHQWIIITIDLFNTFARNCTAEDYKFWSPSPPNSTVHCVLGTKEIFQTRMPHTNCYNGVGYVRPIKKVICQCGRRDYECDFGFVLSSNVCIKNQTLKFDPYEVPSNCQPGHSYKRTKGYRKIDGDVCATPYYTPYEPDTIPCPLEEPSEFILVALKDKIARINLSDNTTVIAITGQENILAIEFDMKNNCIYWSDTAVDTINRQCFGNGTKREIIVDTDLASIEGMALDWISNVLFFVDGLRKKIEAVRTDLSSQNRMRTTILDAKVLSQPRGIAVHPRAGFLFWTDWDKKHPSVSRSHLDGSNVKKLFTNPVVQWPNGITIDQMAERIYWVDAKEDYIASADLNGQYFRRILWHDRKVFHPFAIAVLKDKMYWDDWQAKSIFMADKDTGANAITIDDSFTDLMDLKVFAHFMQHGSNACSYKNTSCDTLCLGGPGKTFSCLCPDGFKKVNGKCMCLNGMEPSANMTCMKISGTCTPNEFTCKNGMCINSTLRCNGYNDCGDQSDESGCLCEPPMVACGDTSCYMPQWRCDGDIDCPDMTDENGVCIPLSWVCDGARDCAHGGDERDCERASTAAPSAACGPDATPCGDGRGCVRLDQLCDRGGLPRHGNCSDRYFECDDGAKCLWTMLVCNGRQDCYDGSDEADCSGEASDIDHMYNASINSSSFLISCWLAQRRMVMYDFLPAIAKVEDNVWTNMTWTNSSIYRFTDLEPFTNYNVTVYVRDSISRRVFATYKYVNTTTGEGVPSAPRRLTVRQMVGSRVNLLWDPPSSPRGVIKSYTIYYVPPLPPMEKIVPAGTYNTTVSFILHGYFKPNTNYSFWVTATNDAYTSNSTDICYLLFDDVSDVDDIVDVSMRRINDTALSLEWHKVRGVEGYLVEPRFPRNYVLRDFINTTVNNVTLTNLPPGVQIYVDIRAYKDDVIGSPFTLPIPKRGVADETLNMTAALLKEKGTSVELSWSRPLAERYRGVDLEYEVHYCNIHDWKMNPVTMDNGTVIVTKNTSAIVEGLNACESYLFTVGLKNGPLALMKEIITRENPKAPVKDLRFAFNDEKSELRIYWRANCDIIKDPVSYRTATPGSSEICGFYKTDKEIPEDLLHPTEDMRTYEAEFSPLLVSHGPQGDGPVFVSVRAVTEDGYYSDLSEVQSLLMTGLEEPEAIVSTSGAVLWGALCAALAAVVLGVCLLSTTLRNRRLHRRR